MTRFYAARVNRGFSVRSIIGYFVRHRTAANLLFILIVVAGIAAGPRMRAQFLPDTTPAIAEITISWPGGGPKEVDRAIVSRVEPKLHAVKGVETVTAVARQGAAAFSLEFAPGSDMAAIMGEVRAAVEEVRDLPEGASRPIISRRRASDSVLDVVITGAASNELLIRYAEELKTRLLQHGVVGTAIDGVRAAEIHVDLRPEARERYDLTLQSIADAIRANAGAPAAGGIDQNSSRITLTPQPLTTTAVGSVAIRSLPDGSKLRVSDVANVIEKGSDREAAIYYQGRPAVILKVSLDGGDMIRLQRTVEAAISEVQTGLPNGVSMFLSHPRGEQVISGLGSLIGSAMIGLAIVLTLPFLFLNASIAIRVAASTSVALLATVALMYAFGLTFNVVTLTALLTCLGVIAHQAATIGERAYQLARHGLPPAEAATRAPLEMAAYLTPAVITLVIAFAALALIHGRSGRLLADIPVTVGVAILASLACSFLILPAHLHRALSKTGRRSLNRESWFRENLFSPFLRLVVRLKYPVVAAAVLLLALAVSAPMERTVTWHLFSSPERSTVEANLAMLEGATRADSEAMVAELERSLQAVNDRYTKQYGTPPVKLALAKVGGTTGRGLKIADAKEPSQLAGYEIELIEPGERPYSAAQFIADWEAEIRPAPLLETLALHDDRPAPGGDDIAIRLTGASDTVLKSAAEALKASLKRYRNVSGIEDDLAYGKPEYLAALTAKGEALGFTTQSVARGLHERLNGIEAVRLARGNGEIAVKVRPPASEMGPAFLHQASLPIPGGGFASLSEIATITKVQDFASIRRENGVRTVTVTGDLAEDAAAAKEVMSALRDEILPDISTRFGVDWSLGGLAEHERDFFAAAAIACALALMAIYTVLAWALGSWTRPLTVMLVIPLGLIGAVWGHWVHGAPISMFSIVGLVAMVALLVNGALAMITAIDERSPRQDMIGAIVDGTGDRLRAIFLMTASTVGALAPLLVGAGRGALFLKPAAITLTYGLGVGMLLALIVIPAILAIQHDMAMSLKSLRRFAAVRRRARSVGCADIAYEEEPEEPSLKAA